MEKIDEKAVGRDSDKFMLRLPDGMRERIAKVAKQNGRSMNAEIVARLDESLPELWQEETRREMPPVILTAEQFGALTDAAKKALQEALEFIREGPPIGDCLLYTSPSPRD